MKTALHVAGTFFYLAAFLALAAVILAIDLIFYGDLPECLERELYPKDKYKQKAPTR